MATDKNTLKNWFRNKLKPTQEQFWAWMDSYWHKDEKISISSIYGLENLLNDTATNEQISALVERISALELAERKGLQHGTSISLTANVATKYTLPDNSQLFAIEMQGSATVQVGSTADTMGDLGELTGSSGDIVQIGLLTASEVWLQSDLDVSVTPIIYRK